MTSQYETLLDQMERLRRYVVCFSYDQYQDMPTEDTRSPTQGLQYSIESLRKLTVATIRKSYDDKWLGPLMSIRAHQYFASLGHYFDIAPLLENAHACISKLLSLHQLLDNYMRSHQWLVDFNSRDSNNVSLDQFMQWCDAELRNIYVSIKRSAWVMRFLGRVSPGDEHSVDDSPLVYVPNCRLQLIYLADQDGAVPPSANLFWLGGYSAPKRDGGRSPGRIKIGEPLTDAFVDDLLHNAHLDYTKVRKFPYQQEIPVAKDIVVNGQKYWGFEIKKLEKPRPGKEIDSHAVVFARYHVCVESFVPNASGVPLAQPSRGRVFSAESHNTLQVPVQTFGDAAGPSRKRSSSACSTDSAGSGFQHVNANAIATYCLSLPIGAVCGNHQEVSHHTTVIVDRLRCDDCCSLSQQINNGVAFTTERLEHYFEYYRCSLFHKLSKAAPLSETSGAFMRKIYMQKRLEPPDASSQESVQSGRSEKDTPRLWIKCDMDARQHIDYLIVFENFAKTIFDRSGDFSTKCLCNEDSAQKRERADQPPCMRRLFAMGIIQIDSQARCEEMVRAFAQSRRGQRAMVIRLDERCLNYADNADRKAGYGRFVIVYMDPHYTVQKVFYPMSGIKMTLPTYVEMALPGIDYICTGWRDGLLSSEPRSRLVGDTAEQLATADARWAGFADAPLLHTGGQAAYVAAPPPSVDYDDGDRSAVREYNFEKILENWKNTTLPRFLMELPLMMSSNGGQSSTMEPQSSGASYRSNRSVSNSSCVWPLSNSSHASASSLANSPPEQDVAVMRQQQHEQHQQVAMQLQQHQHAMHYGGGIDNANYWGVMPQPHEYGGHAAPAQAAPAPFQGAPLAGAPPNALVQPAFADVGGGFIANQMEYNNAGVPIHNDAVDGGNNAAMHMEAAPAGIVYPPAPAQYHQAQPMQQHQQQPVPRVDMEEDVIPIN